MVVIKNLDTMFWGVTIDAGKRYSQVVKQGFHVSMAALEASAKKPSENVQVMLQYESSEYLLCTLHNNLLQQPLDLNFAAGEQVSFSLNGSGVVHLTGYLIPEDDLDDFEDESFSEIEDEEAPSLIDSSGDDKNLLAGKRKAVTLSNTSKKMKLSESIDDDEEDEDYDEEDSEDEEGFSDDFEDDDFTSDDEDDDIAQTAKGKDKTPTKSPKTPTAANQVKKLNAKTPLQDVSTPGKAGKTVKQEAKTPKAQKETPETPKQAQTASATNTPSASGGEESAKKKKKKKKKKNKDGKESQNESTASTPGTSPSSTPGTATKTESTPKKRIVAGGTIVEDLKVGHGPEAKPGKMVSVYYVGTLAKTNKRFDSCTDGKPFRFRLNQGEVIKGWDNGVLGMKVGGKRRITVPANQGYGNVKQGPIPPNSTLVFEVELKAVS